MTDQIKQFQGTVLEQGYGIVGRAVMQDRAIPAEAKGLYAYLCCFSNPPIDEICRDLDISKDMYFSCRKILIERGYSEGVAENENF
jgi:hypothetical protein